MEFDDVFDVSKIDSKLVDELLSCIPNDIPFKSSIQNLLNKFIDKESEESEESEKQEQEPEQEFSEEQIDAEVDQVLEHDIDDEVDKLLERELILSQIKQIEWDQFFQIVSNSMNKLPFRDDFWKSMCCNDIVIKSLYNIVQNDCENVNQIIESSIINEFQYKSQEYCFPLRNIFEQMKNDEKMNNL